MPKYKLVCAPDVRIRTDIPFMTDISLRENDILTLDGVDSRVSCVCEVRDGMMGVWLEPLRFVVGCVEEGA